MHPSAQLIIILTRRFAPKLILLRRFFPRCSSQYHNTLLDSHYYHVFAATPRSFSPRQHIAYVCEKNTRDLNSCCWDSDSSDAVRSEGMGRMMGEWSASFDTLVCDKLDDVMKSYETGGEILAFYREIGDKRKGK